MSTKHVRTGGEVLRFGCSVRVECGHCGSARTFGAHDWVMAAGGGSLEAARRRLKCGQCGRNGAGGGDAGELSRSGMGGRSIRYGFKSVSF